MIRRTILVRISPSTTLHASSKYNNESRSLNRLLEENLRIWYHTMRRAASSWLACDWKQPQKRATPMPSFSNFRNTASAFWDLININANPEHVFALCSKFMQQIEPSKLYDTSTVSARMFSFLLPPTFFYFSYLITAAAAAVPTLTNTPQLPQPIPLQQPNSATVSSLKYAKIQPPHATVRYHMADTDICTQIPATLIPTAFLRGTSPIHSTTFT